ncbi:MAG TPA: glycosyltransferase family 2 protein [Planctomycetes bacterium]|nr:glycosyltransferase family 2 protein [Planctomycetota bacterium]
MSSEEVTATITNWNGRQYLEGCIGSLLAQTHVPSRIILVDNASTDGSVAFVQERFPSVEILSLPTNEGPCPARNAGLEAAETPWVLQVDNDVNLAPDCLERLLAHRDTECAILQPRALFDGERDRVHYDGGHFHYVGMMTLINFYKPLRDAGDHPSRIDAAISFALLLDRDKVLEAGAYDPAHFILFEDHDLSLRVRQRGYLVRHVPDAIAYHREGTAGISFREEKAYAPSRVFFHSRNRWLVLLKCHSWRSLLFGAPGLLAYEVAYFVFALREGHGIAWFRGKWKLLLALPRLLRQRRVVQRARRVRDRDLLRADPLTVSPLIRPGRALRALSRFLTFWWRLVRPLA